MYPHKVDRWRIFGLLIDKMCERWKEKDRDEFEIAELSNVSQPFVSHLRNPIQKDGSPRSIGRKSVVPVLALGLDLDLAEVNALLWLFDRSPLTSKERERVCKLSGRQDATVSDVLNEGTEETFRGTTLRLFRDAIEHENPEASIRMRFHAEPADRLEELKAFHDYEKHPGQRLFTSSLPSTLVSPVEFFSDERLIPADIKAAGMAKEYRSLYQDRQKTFVAHLKEYGERSIHLRDTLARYARDGDYHRLPLELRHRQIENWIKLLKQHENYEVGLTDNMPYFETGAKTTPVALIRGLRQDRGYAHPVLSIHHIFWNDHNSAYAFVLSFEHMWDNLKPEEKEKRAVIEYLRSLIPAEGLRV